MSAALKLTRRPEFLHVAGKGRRWVGPGLVLQALRRFDSAIPETAIRFGLTASRKVGGAVQRNRARRLMKEVYRLHQHQIREGFDIVVVGRGPLADADYKKAAKEMLYLFKKCKLLKDN